MTSNQEIFKNNEQNANHYPSVKVIVGFVLFGGAIGSIILSTYILIINIINGVHWLDVEFFLLIVFVGSFVVLIPSFLVGSYCAIRDFIIKKWVDYIHLYFVGKIISVIYFLLYIFIYLSSDEVFKMMFDTLFFGTIGGISSIICGKLFLPKLPKEFEK